MNEDNAGAASASRTRSEKEKARPWFSQDASAFLDDPQPGDVLQKAEGAAHAALVGKVVSKGFRGLRSGPAAPRREAPRYRN